MGNSRRVRNFLNALADFVGEEEIKETFNSYLEDQNKDDKDLPMSAKEFADQMQELAINWQSDEEMFHRHADDLICKLLVSLGYEEGIKVFDETPKWYA